MRAETNDKIVLISNFTTTLDLFQKLCDSKRCVHLPLVSLPRPVELTAGSAPRDTGSVGCASTAL